MPWELQSYPTRRSSDLEVRAASGVPPVMSRAGATLVAVTSMVPGLAMWLPARSVGPLEADEMLTETWSPPLGGSDRVRPTVELVVPEHDTAVTLRKRPGIETLKPFGKRDEHTRGMAEAAVTDEA